MAASTDKDLHQSLIDQGYTQQQGKPNQYWKPGEKDVFTDNNWISRYGETSWEKHGKGNKY